MPFPITIILFSTRQPYTVMAEKIPSPEGFKRFRISGKTKSVIIQKDTSINNSPWELLEGSWSGISAADFHDLIRQMGAAIERQGY